jgi:nickel-type superoxide dismutase maturation protease
MASGDQGSGRAGFLPIRIIGRSMEPALREGDWVLTRYNPQGLSERAIKKSMGKVVLVRRSVEPELLTVKRLKRALDTGYWVEGDNPDASTDSRQYLTIAREEIVGRILFRYRRKRMR